MVLLLIGKTSKERFHLLQVKIFAKILQISYLSSKQLFENPVLLATNLLQVYAAYPEMRNMKFCALTE